jgi:hypothetical protein
MLNAFVATEVSEQVLDMAPFVFHHDNFFIIVIVLIHSSSAVEKNCGKTRRAFSGRPLKAARAPTGQHILLFAVWVST